MFQIKPPLLALCAIEYMLEESPIFRMRSLNYSREVRWIRKITFKRPESLRGSVNLSAGENPTKTARMTESLSLSQVSLAAAQRLHGERTLGSFRSFPQRTDHRGYKPR